MEFQIAFPLVYGETKFTSMDQVEQLAAQKNADALGLYAQCRLYGAGVNKSGITAIDDLFYSAEAGCSDAILFLGRLYERGMIFIPQDIEQALCLYKYAYSLQNIDALHSLGYVLFSTVPNKKAYGLAMMRLSAKFGSSGAKFHLDLLKDKIADVEEVSFYDIPKSEFEFNLDAARSSVKLYKVDLNDKDAIKQGLLDVLVELGAGTFSETFASFSAKYLRGREYEFFEGYPFREAFEDLKHEKKIETVDMSTVTNPGGGYGAAEDTLYKAKFTAESKNLVSHNLNELLGDDWDF